MPQQMVDFTRDTIPAVLFAFKQDVWLKTAVGKDLITEAAQRGIAVHQYKGARNGSRLNPVWPGVLPAGAAFAPPGGRPG